MHKCATTYTIKIYTHEVGLKKHYFPKFRILLRLTASRALWTLGLTPDLRGSILVFHLDTFIEKVYFTGSDPILHRNGVATVFV